MGQPAARVGDMHVCPMFDGLKPHVGGPVMPPGKPTVLIGGMPAATITDRCFCVSAPDIIVQGARTVLINGMMAARLGDMTVHGGRIVVGCPTVSIGGPTFTTPSFFAKFLNVFLDNLKFNAGIIVGFGEGLWGTIEGLYNVLTHPIDTIKGIFQLADSVISALAKKETWIALTQKETWDKIKNGLGQIYDDFERASPYEKGKVVGHATEFIAELLVPVSKAKLATEAAEAAKIAKATRVAAGLEVAEETGKAAKAIVELGPIGRIVSDIEIGLKKSGVKLVDEGPRIFTQGDPSKVIVIGRSMDTRVHVVAEHLRAESWKDFDSSLPANVNLANNKAWLKSRLDEGYSIVDIGLDPDYAVGGSLEKGPYYGMETETVEDFFGVTPE